MKKPGLEHKTKKGLIKLVHSLNEEKEEYIDKWKRALAELENYRKRNEKQLEDVRKFANEDILYDLLSVVDNFERAFLHIENSKSIAVLRQGIEMIYKDLKTLLNQYGVKHIEALGKKYDPNFHEAVEEIKQENNSQSNTYVVVEEVLPGYMLHDRLLRPAKVKVSTE
jgi:molecular chaperone GrpE